jgi:DNA polymerase III alpha subunit
MRTDKFSNPIFNKKDIFDALYAGHQIPLTTIVTEKCYEISQLSTVSEIEIHQFDESVNSLSIEEYDMLNQNEWFMPDYYYNFDVESYCIAKCNSTIETTRVHEELTEFKNRNMMHLLQWLKFFIDTCLENNVVWGVGRGSSVSSFVLYLLGVHKIDSIKYNLDWHDFLR